MEKALASVSHLGGANVFVTPRTGPARPGIKRHATTIVQAKKVDDEDAEVGGLAGLFSAFAPKPAGQTTSGTQRISRSSTTGTQKKTAKQGGTQSFFPNFGGGGAPKMDARTVFVAGATGRLGIRTVRELAAAGFTVRAGVRSQEKAEAFEDILQELCEAVGPLSRAESSKIKVVFCDLEDPDSIAPAIGNASRVVCCVGAADSEFTNLSAPRRIDYEGTERLIEAAANLDIPQFILVTSLGTGKLGFPAGILNLFGGVLIFKRKAEEALERSGMPYLIVRPGGMERPKDDHKLTHNVRLSTRDTLFGGTVSRLQVAELITAAVLSPEVAENKTLEVVAEKTAPLMEYEELLARAPVEIEQETRKAALEAERELRAALEEATAELDESKERLGAIREAIAELQSQAAEARAAAKAAEKEQGAQLKEAQKAEAQLARLQEEAEQKTLLAAAAKAVATEAQRAQREARLLSRQEIAAIRDSVLNPQVEEEEAEVTERAPAPALFGLFGTQVKKAAVQEEEEAEEEVEEEEEVQPAVPALFAGIFGGTPKKTAPAPVEEEEVVEEEEEEEVVVAQPNKKQTQNAFAGIANFFQGQPAVFIDELEEAKEEAPAPVPATVAVASAPTEPAPAAPKPQTPAFQMPQFGGFKLPELPSFPGAQDQGTEAEPESSADAESEAKAAAEAEAAAKAEAEAAEAAARKEAAAKAQREAEARAVAQMEAERAQREAEEATRKAAEEEKARETAAAAAAAAADAEAKAAAKEGDGNPFAGLLQNVSMPWAQQQEEAAPAPPAAVSGELENVKEARAWVAAWKQAQAQGESGSGGNGAAPPATDAAPEAKVEAASADEGVPENVRDARSWIAAWRSRN